MHRARRFRQACWLIALAVGGSAIAVSAEPESAETVAERNQAKLTSPGVHFIDGYCFSVGSYGSTGTADGDLATTEEAATTAAYGHFLAAALIIDDAPPGLRSEVRDAVRKSSAEKVVRRLQLSGVDEIEDDVDDAGNARIVLAVRESAIDAEKRHWQGCVDLVQESALDGDAADARLWAEVLANTGKDTAPAIDAWLKILSASPGLAATITGSPIGVTDGWKKLPAEIDAKLISSLPDERLLQLLDRRPFDGRLIDAYANRLLEPGHVAASRAVSKWYRVTPSEPPSLPAVLEATFLAAGLNSSNIPGVRILLRFADSWPKYPAEQASAEAVALFRKAESAAALRLFLEQFSDRPNPDTANYIAAALLAVESPTAAEFWSRLAFEWSPLHAYAGVNLMRAIEKQGRLADAKQVAAKLNGKQFLDEWGRSEVQRVLAIEQ